MACALVAMLPNAEVLSRSERSWHSATFAGSRIILSLAVPSDTDRTLLENFRATLPDHDFALKLGFVADIAIISESTSADEKTALEIEAMLLDD
jgi:hypothetical protein